MLLWEVMSYGQHPYEAEDWDNQTVSVREGVYGVWVACIPLDSVGEALCVLCAS